MVQYCAVSGCLMNNKRNAVRRFFRFPNNETRCRQWIRAIGRTDLESKAVNILHTNYRICDLHFSESDIQGRYLKFNASPTLLLPNEDALPQSHLANLWDLSKSVQTDIPAELPVPVLTKSIQTDTELSCKSCKLQMSAQDCWQIPSTSKAFQCQTSNASSANIPSEHERRSQWLKSIAREDLINRHTDNRVCHVHFKDQDIQMKTNRKTLNKSALPSLHLPCLFKEDKQTQIEIMTCSTPSQTDMTLLENLAEIYLTTDSIAINTGSNTSQNMTQTSLLLSADTPRKRKLLKLHETGQTTVCWYVLLSRSKRGNESTT